MAKSKVSQKLQPWIDARKRFRLSHAHVQMARELGVGKATVQRRLKSVLAHPGKEQAV